MTAFPGAGWGSQFPCAETTGPTAGGYTSLTPVTAAAYQIKVDNTGSWPSWVQTLSAGNYLIEGCAFAPGANIFSNVANLTIRGCTIQPTGLAAVNFQGGNLTMAYCRVGAPDQSGANHLHEVIDGDIMTGDLTVDHCDFYWWAQAIHAPKQTTYVLDSYIHDPTYQQADHSEPITLPAGATPNLIAIRSTLLISLTQTAVIAGASTGTSFTVVGCLLGGGGYCLYSYTAASNIVVRDNRFTTMFFANGGLYGLFDNAPAWTGTNIWSGNRWHDGPNAGQVISAP